MNQKLKYQVYLRIFLFVALAVLANWSIWHSPWRVGTFYRVLISIVFLLIISVYKAIRFLKKRNEIILSKNHINEDCQFNVIRVIEVYENTTGKQIDQMVLSEKKFPLKELYQIIGDNLISGDNNLYHMYEIKPEMKNYFEKKLNRKLDFKNHIYELACYPTEKPVNPENGIRLCNH